MNQKYPLHNLNDEDFEDLSALICERILGTGTFIFSPGKDGGRDGKFTGKANKFPSEAAPWDGKFIIQAKHTTSPIASCSESKFQRILKLELPKLETLKKEGKIDYYLVFTNRKLSGLQDPKIEILIDENTNVDNAIFGNERIQLWLNEYPDVVKTLGLNRLLMPLDFYEEDLQEIIISFSETKISRKKLKSMQDDLRRISIEEKNRINNLGKEYFDNVFKNSYDKFERIKVFLEDPQNEACKIKYQNSVSDLQEEIVIKRDEYGTFEAILNHLYKLILDSNNEKLLNNRRLIRVFLHYMYYVCDIGVKESE